MHQHPPPANPTTHPHTHTKAALVEARDARDGVTSVVGQVSTQARQRLRANLAQLADMDGPQQLERGSQD